jgi:hypothetical protein
MDSVFIKKIGQDLQDLLDFLVPPRGGGKRLLRIAVGKAYIKQRSKVFIISL